jgi:hypothetical protein
MTTIFLQIYFDTDDFGRLLTYLNRYCKLDLDYSAATELERVYIYAYSINLYIVYRRILSTSVSL